MYQPQSGTLAEVKVTGIKTISKKEIFEQISWNPDVPDPSADWKKWESLLAQHPRIRSIKTSYKRGVLELFIEEREAFGILHIGDTLYEFDEEFQIFSRNDTRTVWTPVIAGDFRLSSDAFTEEGAGRGFRDNPPKVTGPLFESLWRQVVRLRREYPEIWARISEVQRRSDGDIYLYFHEPFRCIVNLGPVLSGIQMRKLYSALAYFEAETEKVRFLDLRGEDGFYY